VAVPLCELSERSRIEARSRDAPSRVIRLVGDSAHASRRFNRRKSAVGPILLIAAVYFIIKFRASERR